MFNTADRNISILTRGPGASFLSTAVSCLLQTPSEDQIPFKYIYLYICHILNIVAFYSESKVSKSKLDYVYVLYMFVYCVLLFH